MKLFLVLLAVLVTSSSADAKAIDGKQNLVCATATVVECDASAECIEREAEDVDLPNFIRIDFEKKALSSGDLDSEQKTTAIENLAIKDGKIILQGAEGQRAWSLVVDQATGDMSGAAADSGGGFLIYGACTLP